MEINIWALQSFSINQDSNVNQAGDNSAVCANSGLLDNVTMAHGYCVDQYGQELDNLTFAFDEYYFTPAKSHSQTVAVQEMPLKKEPQSEQSKNSMENEALPVIPMVKIEPLDPGQYGHCFNPTSVPAIRGLGRPNELSLETAFSPTSDLGSSCSASPAIDSDSPDSSVGCGNDPGFEVYQDLIMRHLIQDIQCTCARLGIPRDPKGWTPADSIAWLMDMSAQYHLSEVPFEKLAVDGATLSSMSLGQFVQCFPNGGETVHAQLQIWNSANDYCVRQSNASCSVATRLVDGDEPVAMGTEPTRQFVQVNPGGVIQRLRNANDDEAAFNYAQVPFFIHQSQEQFGNVSQLQAGANFGLGSVLPSPGACSEGGLCTEGDYGTLNVNGGSALDVSGRPNNGGNGNNIHLWQFLRELLEQQEKYGQCVRWIDHNAGIFKIEDSHTLARLWGKRKNRPAMNYDKLSRSLRQYYKKNILKKTTRSQRLVYQFLHPYHVC